MKNKNKNENEMIRYVILFNWFALQHAIASLFNSFSFFHSNNNTLMQHQFTGDTAAVVDRFIKYVLIDTQRF